jgi:transcriptional regulator with XRE-family HTH domain
VCAERVPVEHWRCRADPGREAGGGSRRAVAATYNELVGARLRAIRRQRGLSLQDVQRLSTGEFKAAVVGAYERGERSLSLPRLQRLSQFFQVPISQFMPQDESGKRTMEPLPSGGVTIDLNRLERLSGNEAVIFTRFLRAIQMMRQDFNGKVLTIRRDDLRLLALLIENTEEGLAERLREEGLTTEV